MGLTADRLYQLKLIDQVLPEPLGGAHRGVDAMAKRLQQALTHQLEVLKEISIEELLARRYERLLAIGL